MRSLNIASSYFSKKIVILKNFTIPKIFRTNFQFPSFHQLVCQLKILTNKMRDFVSRQKTFVEYFKTGFNFFIKFNLSRPFSLKNSNKSSPFNSCWDETSQRMRSIHLHWVVSWTDERVQNISHRHKSILIIICKQQTNRNRMLLFITSPKIVSTSLTTQEHPRTERRWRYFDPRTTIEFHDV